MLAAYVGGCCCCVDACSACAIAEPFTAQVPWKLDEDTKYGMDTRASTFRVGLFGLDKLQNVDRTVDTLTAALDRILSATL